MAHIAMEEIKLLRAKPSVTIHFESLPQIRLYKKSTVDVEKGKNTMSRMRPARAPRVVVIDVADFNESILAERNWICQHYPDSKVVYMKVFRLNGRIYDQVILRKPNGQHRIIYFDVARSFHHVAGTQALLGTQGTIVGGAFPTTQLLR